MSEILWVGVGFDPEKCDEELDKQHEIVGGLCRAIEVLHGSEVTGFPSGAVLNAYDIPNPGNLIDIYDGLGSRIGFGIRVGSVAEGKEKLSKAEEWLRARRILLPVSVYAWSPAEDVAARGQT